MISEVSKFRTFLCAKIYRYFVGPVENADRIQALARILVQNDFEIAPVIRELLLSEYFFDTANQGTIIKSPADIEISFVKELELNYLPDFDIENKIRQSCDYLGQNLFSPVDVAGWPGDRNWVGSSSLTGRWERFNYYIWTAWRHDKKQFQALAKRIVGGNSNDARMVSKTIIDHFIARPLQNQNDYEIGYEIFKDQVPENYFEDKSWSLEWDQVPKQMYQLLFYIVKLPEFQLK